VIDLTEAVSRAQSEFPDDLLIGEDVEDGVRELVPEAGPPDKIYDHLKTLAEMARVRRAGALGKNLFDWLADRGVSGSYESEMIANSKAETQKRTWRDGGGGRRTFNAHLKPNENTGPDKCVRIYFEFDDREKKVVVGWIGRHP
jgi:hypothetical protein